MGRTATLGAGWTDWAEWVEPVERSLAAVSSSALTDRIARLFVETPAPAVNHVAVLVDVGSPTDADAACHAVRVATMLELRAHFPFVDAVAALSSTRYAVLARRHPGLAGTLTSLEHRLRGDSGRIDAVATVWCEELPDTPADVAVFVRGLRIKPRTEKQVDRGLLAAGLPVEVLAGAAVAAGTPRRNRPGRWALRSAAAALGTAVMASAAGATTAAVGTAIAPWHARPSAPAVTAREGTPDAGAGILSFFAPSTKPLVGEVTVEAGEPELSPPAPRPETSITAGDPVTGGAPAIPEAPAPPEAPAAPEAPQPPDVPDAPESPEAPVVVPPGDLVPTPGTGEESLLGNLPLVGPLLAVVQSTLTPTSDPTA